ncbi:MAG: Translation initiation factor IF-1 [Candidatus Kaiserbacteria bacterium GW2011_GWC2_49_12]|uniref:Translation initiation factor IF-1 n=2 Tax=Candidatus Kaiseribacteriota TaxID=1752734 RepID=A0A0G1VK76_9BACT|nr:MAG: Translation initiation factor IF-1 [Candidatus Kaiserbacteria bacterium GW2011_GWC2_49_12]
MTLSCEVQFARYFLCFAEPEHRLEGGPSVIKFVIQDMSEPKVVEGVVEEALPNTLFRVKVGGESESTLAYLAGKMRLHRIKVLVGDRVVVQLDPYGGRARITKRL